MTTNWHIRGGTLVDPATGCEEKGDLYLAGGRIVRPDACPPDAAVFDASGCIVSPGFIDLHVHFREPGKEKAEDIASGCRAAVAGGFTTVLMMPNTMPPFDTPERVRDAVRRGKACNGPEVLASCCLTAGRDGHEVADIKRLVEAGAAAVTDDGSTPADATRVREALRLCARVGKPMLDHALDPELSARGVMHEGACSRRLGLSGIPSEAETRIVARDIHLCRETGAAVHIQHVSTRGAVDLIGEAAAAGLPVTGEVTPHHLALTDADIDGTNADFKMNPPLRTGDDREALRAAVADGVLSAFATDHAPHLGEEKALGFEKAPFGIVGLETAVGVTLTELVHTGRMTTVEWVRRWTAGPARMLGRSVAGLGVGAPATLTVVDPAAEWTVDPDAFQSRARNTPFAGRRLRGRSVATFRDGRLLWQAPR